MVEPDLSDIGHGSDALMARTRITAPGSQATTSTGLNYLLGEDNDNIRVPFKDGLTAEKNGTKMGKEKISDKGYQVINLKKKMNKQKCLKQLKSFKCLKELLLSLACLFACLER